MSTAEPPSAADAAGAGTEGTESVAAHARPAGAISLDASDWHDPIVGVLGGVGPAATAVFLDLLVQLTDSSTDQGNIDALITQHSSIPDRTAHILAPEDHPDPGPVLAHDARFLERAGADFLVLPCNTAHYYAQQVRDAIAVDLVSIVRTTTATVQQRLRELGTPDAPVAIFATEGNIAARVYQDALDRVGLTAHEPDADTQAVVNALIYDQVKAGLPADLDALTRIIETAMQQGAGAVIFGCTELSVVFAQQQRLQADQRIVDSLHELALETVRRSGRTVRTR